MKTSVYIGTSLDGFIAREDGNLDWLTRFNNQEVNNSYSDFIRRIDAVVIGRGTFEKVLMFPSWPYEKTVIVLSASLKQIPDNLKGKVTILSLKPKKVLKVLSGDGFTNIYVDGGKVIQDFLKEGCIDELIITRIPVLLGSGIPLFGYLDHYVHFKHRQTQVFSNGLVLSHYRIMRS